MARPSSCCIAPICTPRSLRLSPARSFISNKKLVGLTKIADGVTLEFRRRHAMRVPMLVIAADGVHSLVREILLGAGEPAFHRKGRVPHDVSRRALGTSRITTARTKWWGPDRHIVIYYVTARAGRDLFRHQPAGRCVVDDPGVMVGEGQSGRAAIGLLGVPSGGAGPSSMPVPDVYKWALLERDPLPRWRQGRVVLLGDACHPMTPYMAQGAASALEDAAVLSRCLEGVGSTGSTLAFEQYEATRKPRASEIQGTSSKNTWMRHSTDPSWVYGYDAWKAPLAS